MAGRHRRGRHRKPEVVWPRLVVGVICVTSLVVSVVVVSLGNAGPTPAPLISLPEPSGYRTTDTPAVTTAPTPLPTTTPPPEPAPTTTSSPTSTQTTTEAPPPPATTPPEPEPEPPAAEPEPQPARAPTPDYPTEGFNGVKPHVAVVGHLVAALFGVRVIGVGDRGRKSDHPLGYALDFMVGNDRTKGDAIASCVLDRMSAWHVGYVIWRQRINHGSGWEAMEDRGSATENHFDHVHVSFDHGALPLPLPIALTC